MISTVDEGFIRRVLITCAYVWVCGVLMSLSAFGPYSAIGWTVGAAISVGLLFAIQWVVKKATGPGNTRNKNFLMKAAALHWPIMLVLLGLSVWLGRNKIAYLIAFIAGLSLAQTIIVLKALGIIIIRHFNED